MANNGKIANGVINTPNQEIVLASLDNTVAYGSVQIIIVNRSDTDVATVKIAIVQGSAVITDSDYIEYNSEIAPHDRYTDNVQLLSGGETIKAVSDKGNLTFRIAGLVK